MHRLFAAVIFSYLPLRYGLTSSASLIASVALRWRSGGMVMKRLFLSSILLLTVMVSPSGSFGADFQKGMDAAQRGDFATALKEWKPLAEQGDAPAQNNLGHMHHLGVMYKNGLGVTQDYKTAVKWYTRAAEQGIAPAQFNLGVMYKNGLGVTQDYKTAVKWYTRAADQGNASAQNNLGHMHQNGKGVPQDHAEAFKWYRLAANQGVPDAQLNLGVMYGYGYGVKQDYTRALMWWAIAASQGDETARKNRDIVEKKMSSADVSKAQKLAREWMKKQKK